MREISLNLLDLIQNSIEAHAVQISILINEDVVENKLEIQVVDDGVGIEEENLRKVMDPFYTSRKSRSVGLGLSIFQSMCERCDGSAQIISTKGKGTTVTGNLKLRHFDRPPLGKIEDTIIGILINPDVKIRYTHIHNGEIFEFDSEKVRNLIEFEFNAEIINWIRKYIKEGIMDIGVDPWS